MSQWTIALLRRINPEERLVWSARLFWLSLVGLVFSTLFLCTTWFERVLMFISWLAITATCVGVILEADIREKIEGDGNSS